MKSASITAVVPADGATLQSQVYDELRRLLVQGGIAPGASLTIRGAAQALGVSMMPVRAALQRLETEGALVARGGKRVLGIPELSVDTYRELRDIRIQLEGLAAERAAELVTDDELAEAERHCGEMQAAADAGDRQAYVSANWQFHLSIYRASRMPMLVGLIEALWLRVGPYVATMMPDRAALVASMPDHWQVVEALRDRDGPRARAGIAADIGHSAVALLTAIGGEPEAPARPRRRARAASAR